MKYTLSFLILTTFNLFSQEDNIISNKQSQTPAIDFFGFQSQLTTKSNTLFTSHKPKKPIKTFHISGGIALGQENFIGLPKFNFLKELPIIKSQAKQRYDPKKYRMCDSRFHTFSLYGGGEVSFFYFFLGQLTVSANTGIAFGAFTIDNNITSAMFFGFAYEGSFAKFYHTYNPKIGIIIGPMWLKAGPSFLLSGTPAFPEMMKINGRSFNFELLYTIAR